MQSSAYPVVWAQMPFGSLLYPNLALGQFKAQLQQAGIPNTVINFNLRFGRMIGFAAYETIARFKGVETQVSEWLFSRACWGEDIGLSEDGFLQLCGEELTTIPRVHDRVTYLRKVRREVVPVFLRHCVDTIAQLRPRVVALSCTFFQTLAALTLGRLLREEHPEIKLVYGGACFHGEMGEELIAKTPWIDAVATGEADGEIVPLMRALSNGEVPRDLPGVIARTSDQSLVVGPKPAPATAERLEQLPDPDFDEYFAEAKALGLTRDESWRERVFLPFEASRGCWWGQKHHCTFCGLNAEGMGYRAKSATRVEASVRQLARRYPVRRMNATDNILAIEHMRELLPRLKAFPVETHPQVASRLKLFFEVKANMKRAQIRAMIDAGIEAVQPGIESLSSHHLRLMGKGVTALQNVFFLKCCREFGISVLWNILIRIPGEEQNDYTQMSAWISRLTHFQPPSGGAPLVECHRFAPYFSQHERWLTNLAPMPWYRGLFPQDRYDLRKVAYYFDGTWKDTLGGSAYDELRARTLAWSTRWRTGEHMPNLTYVPSHDGGLRIVDTRGPVDEYWQLDPSQAQLYRTLDDPVRPAHVRARLIQETGSSASEATIRGVLLGFVDAGIALEERDQFLGLALPQTATNVARDIRRSRLREIVNQGPTAARTQVAMGPMGPEGSPGMRLHVVNTQS